MDGVAVEWVAVDGVAGGFALACTCAMCSFTAAATGVMRVPMIRAASVPFFAQAGKSHQLHAALMVPFGPCFTGISRPQHMHSMVPIVSFGVVAIKPPLLGNQCRSPCTVRRMLGRMPLPSSPAPSKSVR